METLQAFVAANPLIVVAHRGSSGTAPENTFASLRQALDAGVQMIEIDVQVTGDGDVVVFHDETVARTTNSRGSVNGMSCADLQALDAGSWFDRAFAGERVPRLREALEFLRGKAYLNIEVKPPRPGEQYVERIDRIVTITQAAGCIPYTLFSSFHHQSLVYLKSLSVDHHTAAIQVPGDDRLPSAVVKQSGCDAFVCALRELTAGGAVDLQEHGIYAGVYTINTEEELEQALQLKVNALVTNFPAAMLQALRKRGSALPQFR